ncbi:MAG TPA: AMP-binding protein [Candidatus Limnocylindrales bacterium]|nr:AMP-binding protein [Candidatus Limnocylindrales bacterium]
MESGDTVLDLFDRAVERFGDRPALALHGDDGRLRWSFRELQHRSRLAAWRLRAAGLEPGDRILTWSPATPELPAAYFGAMRAGIVFVPLDLAMAPDAISRIAARADAKRLILGTGRDAPDPAEAGLQQFPTTLLDALTADADDSFPPDWEARLDAWRRPAPEDVFELVFTSGTTAAPKGVILAHDNVAASIGAMHRVIPPIEHRVVSLMPLSHLFEQAVSLFYALDVGASILYVRSLNPRVIFDAIRSHHATSMVLVPHVLELFWAGIQREVDRTGRTASFDRLRRIARHLPYALRRLLFRSLHERFGGGLRLFVSAGAFLPPALQQAWEDLGVIVIQGYGSTETGFGACTTREDHGLGTVGRPMPPVEMRLAADGEIQFRGPTLFKGYWHDPGTTGGAFTDDGWYRTGDIGRLDGAGRLILMGRTKDIIVLPSGLNVYPEDVENALRTAGLRESVVVETRPGRIEAVVLGPRGTSEGATEAGAGPNDAASAEAPEGDLPAVATEPLQAAVRAANATLAPHQRVAAIRIWYEDDFPRTNTLKVRRDVVRRWAVADEPLPVRQGDA